MAAPDSRNLRRDVGLIGLCFVAVSGMLGAGWLFAPMLVSQQAGPAGMISWVIGGLMVLLITLTFAEISSLLPVAGGIVRIPHFSHGNTIGTAMGFTAWIGYSLNAPISTLVLLEYAGHDFTWIYKGAVGNHDLSAGGMAVAAAIMLLMVLINIVGVAALARCNTAITWFKIIIPFVVGGAIIGNRFEPDNFAAIGGFAPYGFEGILGGVATGGVVFAFIGFRHAIDMAGETRNPQVTIPLALTIAVVICILVYAFVQAAFIGAIPAADLSAGWRKLHFAHQLGPIAGLAAAIGLAWVGVVIYGGAIIAPFGGALVSTTSNARLALALGQIGFLSQFFVLLSSRGVPVRALALNYVIGIVLIAVLPFDEMLTLNIATIVLSLCVGPISLATFRRQLPDRRRGFSLPLASITAPAALICTALILYWAGWTTMWHLAIALAGGGVFYGFRLLRDRSLLDGLDLQQALWLPPFLAGIWIISYLGNFDGGLKLIPFGLDLILCAAVAIAVFPLAVRCGLPVERVQRNVAREFAEDGAITQSAKI